MQFGVYRARTSPCCQSHRCFKPLPKFVAASLTCAYVYERLVYGSEYITMRSCQLGWKEWLKDYVFRFTFVITKRLIFPFEEKAPDIHIGYR
jgi:hypothetical protein